MRTAVCCLVIAALFHLIFKVNTFKIVKVSFENWKKADEMSCNVFNVTFSTENITIHENNRIQLTVINSGVDSQYECQNHNSTYGICMVSTFLGNYDDTTLNFTLRSKNITKPLLSQTISTKLEDRALELAVEEVGSNTAKIQWLLPWNTSCPYLIATVNYKWDVCAHVGNTWRCSSDSSSENIEKESSCVLTKEKIFSCLKPIENLQADTNYVFKIKYSLGVPAVKWSEWSNVLNFTTNSIVPKVSPTIRCTSKDGFIKLYWKSLVAFDGIGSLYFKLSYGDQTFNIKSHRNSPDYHHTLKVGRSKRVYIQACSNSGCAFTNSLNTCPIDTHRSIQLELEWLLFLLVPIFLTVVVFIFRKKIKRLVCKIKIGENDLVHPRAPAAPETNNLQGFTADGIYMNPVSRI